MPYFQTKCDCGYQFKQHRRPRPAALITSAALSAALFFFAGYGVARFSSSGHVASTLGNSERNAEIYAKYGLDETGKKASSNHSTSSALDARKETYALPTPIEAKNGEILHEPSAEKIAPLTIKASDSKNYYVFLRCTGYDTPRGYGLDDAGCRANDMSFYVKNGSSVSVNVPLGLYEIYYATGNTWYGEGHLFGNETARYKCNEEFEFYVDGDYVEGYALTLYAVPNGNMDTEKVPENEFPVFGQRT